MAGGTVFDTGELNSAPARDVLGGRYELGDLLGSGGMAEVHAARDRVLDRDVAIKFFRPLDDRADRARFVGEARMLAGLSHPGLVTVFDASFEDHRRPYLIMRLVDGGTLRQRINTDGPLAPGQVAALGARLATALGHVHAKEIVHRDVKPSNVLVDSAGDYYLADFGLAWALGSARLTNTGEFVGTACYLAPEQVTGAVVGPKADIYALGLVLLECLTGRTEYEGSDIEVAVARLSRPPAVPGDYGPAWQHLLAAMTGNRPANRPDAMECARRLHAMSRGAARVDARGTAQRTVPAIYDTGARTAELRTPAVPTATRSRRSGKLRAGLGGVGAAGVVLTALMLTTPGGTAGRPVPGGAPGQPITVPARDHVRHKPAPADKTAPATTARSTKNAGAGKPARNAAPSKTGKPTHGAKPRHERAPGPKVAKPEKGD